MEAIKSFFVSVFGAAAGAVMLAFYLSFSVGTLYWVWMSIQLGSDLLP